MSKYLIQTKEETNNKTIGEQMVKNIRGENWKTKNGAYDCFEDAEKYCVDVIKLRLYKAENIRIVKVVGEFESNITVKTKEADKEEVKD